MSQRIFEKKSRFPSGRWPRRTGSGYRFLLLSSLALIVVIGCWDEEIDATSLLFPIKAIVIDPETTTTLYIGTFGVGIFKSIDGGDTWQKARGGLIDLLVKAVAIDPEDTDRLYAGTENGGVFQSIDGGATWLRSTGTLIANRDVTSLVLDPSNCPFLLLPCDTIYAGTLGGGVFKTTKRVLDWSDASAGLSDLDVTALTLFVDANSIHLFAATVNGRVFESINRGTSWAERSLSSLGEIFSLVTDPDNPLILYLGIAEGGGGYKSSNGGVTWQKMDNLLPPPGEETVIVVDPKEPSILYASSLDRISRSEDRGVTWVPFNAGLPSEVVDIHSLAIDPNSTATAPILYAGTFGGRLFKYKGNSWSELTIQ